jgi:hypothetical protein
MGHIGGGFLANLTRLIAYREVSLEALNLLGDGFLALKYLFVS